jgi:erythrin-vacuolar iron transport family protein
MEAAGARLLHRAAARTQDAATRRLLGDLAAAEAAHEGRADALEAEHLGDARAARIWPSGGSSS